MSPHLATLLTQTTQYELLIHFFSDLLCFSRMAASSTNSIDASATTTSDYCYAFLNHRGNDVKETLATHLYQHLTVRGMRVFLHKEELLEGDNLPSQLKGAIRSAMKSESSLQKRRYDP